MPKLTQKDKDTIKILTKYPEYKTLERILKEYVEELKDLTTMGLPKLTIAEEMAGRIWAIKALGQFFVEIELAKIEPVKKTNIDYN